jgi:hypothetical protein
MLDHASFLFDLKHHFVNVLEMQICNITTSLHSNNFHIPLESMLDHYKICLTPHK